MHRDPERREDQRRYPGGGDEFLLEPRIDRGRGIAAAGGRDPRLRMAHLASGQDGEEHHPPDDQKGRDRGLQIHQWTSFGSAISSTRTPPMSLGCTKITGTPWA